MKTARLTVDGLPIVSEHRKRCIRRRKADIAAHEAKLQHRLTLEGLWAAIKMIESKYHSPEMLRMLKEAAQRAEVATR